MDCHRCENVIDTACDGGYVEQVVATQTGTLVRVPYHRDCWYDNEHTWRTFKDPTSA